LSAYKPQGSGDQYSTKPVTHTSLYWGFVNRIPRSRSPAPPTPSPGLGFQGREAEDLDLGLMSLTRSLSPLPHTLRPPLTALVVVPVSLHLGFWDLTLPHIGLHPAALAWPAKRHYTATAPPLHHRSSLSGTITTTTATVCRAGGDPLLGGPQVSPRASCSPHHGPCMTE
jgi:hypothetical protein